MLPSKQDFFREHHVSEEDFVKSGYEWNDLMEIYEDYSKEIKDFKILADFIEECMVDVKKAHSIKKRIKDPSHLIRKIIRKKIDKDETVTVADYKEKITDLIGIRVLHLFKEDWMSIHDDIVSKWIMKEQPVANVRDGDKSEFIEQFKSQGLEILQHKYGYRSVHYQILLVHNKKEITAEIQVRTLFEEAWSEIDHRMRYPYNLNDAIMSEYLVIFNRLAGSADEMGTFIKMLKKDHDKQALECSDKNRLINQIIDEIGVSNLSQPQKYDLTSKILALAENSSGNHKHNPYQMKNNTYHDTAVSKSSGSIESRSDRQEKSEKDAESIDELMKLEREMGIY
jgi:putative GTP pyrophosphokinase